MLAHGASSTLSDSATQLSGCQGHRTVAASAMADAAIAGGGVQLPCPLALAFFYLWPPSPLAIIRRLFAPPRTQQCRRNGKIASPISPCSIGAPLVVPGSAHRRRQCSAQDSPQGSLSVSASAVKRLHSWPENASKRQRAQLHVQTFGSWPSVRSCPNPSSQHQALSVQCGRVWEDPEHAASL